MKRMTKPVSDDLISFTRHLASAVKMKLPLVTTLEVMEREIKNKSFLRIVKDITSRVKQGEPLSKALENHPEEFPEYYRKMVAAGEEGQTLDEVFEQLSDYVEGSYKLEKKIRSAFAYPSIVGVLIIIDLFLAGSIGIFPRYKAIYAEMGAEVPAFTAIFLALGDKFFYALGTVFLVFGILAALFFYSGYFRSKGGKVTKDRLILHLPLVGITARKSAAARFSRTLGSLLKGGIPLPDALRLTANTNPNEVIRQSVMDVHDHIIQGETLSSQLTNVEIFPPTMVWMISQGEEQGELIPTLNHLADFYDTQVESSIHVATSVFEPIVIILLGIIVTFFVAALYLPLFNIMNVLR